MLVEVPIVLFSKSVLFLPLHFKQKGAEVNAQNRTGETPLHNACCYGHVEIVQVLLDLGAKPNLTTITTKETPLHWAARLKSPDIVALLLNAGADPTIEGKDGFTFAISGI